MRNFEAEGCIWGEHRWHACRWQMTYWLDSVLYRTVSKEKKNECPLLPPRTLMFDVVWALLRLNCSKSNKTFSCIHYNHPEDKSLSWVSKRTAKYSHGTYSPWRVDCPQSNRFCEIIQNRLKVEAWNFSNEKQACHKPFLRIQRLTQSQVVNSTRRTFALQTLNFSPHVSQMNPPFQKVAQFLSN